MEALSRPEHYNPKTLYKAAHVVFDEIKKQHPPGVNDYFYNAYQSVTEGVVITQSHDLAALDNLKKFEGVNPTPPEAQVYKALKKGGPIRMEVTTIYTIKPDNPQDVMNEVAQVLRDVIPSERNAARRTITEVGDLLLKRFPDHRFTFELNQLSNQTVSEGKARMVVTFIFELSYQ